jgi:hypothetical protein
MNLRASYSLLKKLTILQLSRLLSPAARGEGGGGGRAVPRKGVKGGEGGVEILCSPMDIVDFRVGNFIPAKGARTQVGIGSFVSVHQPMQLGNSIPDSVSGIDSSPISGTL